MLINRYKYYISRRILKKILFKHKKKRSQKCKNIKKKKLRKYNSKRERILQKHKNLPKKYHKSAKV